MCAVACPLEKVVMKALAEHVVDSRRPPAWLSVPLVSLGNEDAVAVGTPLPASVKWKESVWSSLLSLGLTARTFPSCQSLRQLTHHSHAAIHMDTATRADLEASDGVQEAEARVVVISRSRGSKASA